MPVVRCQWSVAVVEKTDNEQLTNDTQGGDMLKVSFFMNLPNGKP